MTEDKSGAASGLESRTREWFQDSVANLDMATRSRLTQARYAALEAAAAARARPWFFRLPTWTPVAGVAAAALLGVALWVGGPLGLHGGAEGDGQSSLDDLEIVAASDEGSADAIDMLQDDLDFYDFADRAAASGPAA